MIKKDELVVGNYYEITFESEVFTAIAIDNDWVRTLTLNSKPLVKNGSIGGFHSIFEVSEAYARNPKKVARYVTNESASVLLKKNL